MIVKGKNTEALKFSLYISGGLKALIESLSRDLRVPESKVAKAMLRDWYHQSLDEDISVLKDRLSLWL